MTPSSTPETIGVLLVEEDPDEALRIEDALGEARGIPGFSVVRGADPADVARRVAEGGVDVVLLGLESEADDGLAVVSELRESPLPAPVVVVTDGSDGAAALSAGAADHLRRDRITPELLARVLRWAVERRASADVAAAWRKEDAERIRRLSMAVDQSPASTLITDARGTIEYVNARFTQVTGYLPDEVLGKNPRILQSGRTPPEIYRDLWQTIRGGRVWQGEILNRRKDGTLYLDSVRISPIRDEEGKITHFMGLQEDVSERARLEEELRQAQKMEAVGRLAGGIAHDFNNLLTAILGPTELLLRDLPLDDPLRADLDDVRTAAHSAAKLTRQLLALGRRQVLEPRNVDLNELVGRLDRLLYRLIGEDVELRTVQGQGLGLVRADPAQLEQVLLNLTINARDAMPDGGVLSVETSNVELDALYYEGRHRVPPGDYVMLAVSDTGQGMVRAVQEKIFEPFFTTKPKGRGTGLGLSTVYGIVEQSGGYIHVYSEPGQGTTFKIYLPRVVDGSEPFEGPEVEPASLDGTETILLVEDESTVRTVARKILEARGYQVLAAEGAGRALEMAREHDGAIPLLVTDVVMPEMNGKELSERFLEVRPEARVLFVSGYTHEIVVPHGVLEPGVHFLQKPFTLTSLARKVREVLDGPED